MPFCESCGDWIETKAFKCDSAVFCGKKCHKKNTKKYDRHTGLPNVYFDIGVGGNAIARLVFPLFTPENAS
ncbi:hypothetical protein [Brazilian marseillevirus]|uniref:hypothetical protein n=1 Tax=Brazilian marseillevirus TaxID=1813599 RepID=UPI000783D534|nr:hypothetical protein A3303_gp417 [Brazilian marseillevirus]AMQ10925.1 hypothetical protein [Brazilian marseillevirus]